MARQPEHDESTKERPAGFARRVGWLVILLVPPIFFVLCEWSLRAAGVGTDTDFFIASSDGQEWNTNYRFGRRFFSDGFQIHPDPIAIPREPGPDELRIVLLGGSAAFGDLDQGYGVGRFLEAMFRIRFPNRQTTVIIGALPGANSHVMRLVAEDAMKLGPDLVLVFLGNNEVVGPYGIGSIVTEVDNPLYEPDSLESIRTHLFITSFRLGQGMAALLGGEEAPPASPVPVAPKERLVRESDPGLQRSYDLFARNMRDLVAAPTHAGVPVLVATVPVNLRDFSPLRSFHAPDLSRERKREWNRLWNLGRSLAADDRGREAIAAFDEAAAIDAGHAALAFERAAALERAGRPRDARIAYERARDLDGIRARAGGEVNDVLREVAREHASVSIVDVAADWSAQPTSPGRELFYDHCHLTLLGNYRLAAALFPAAVTAIGLPTTGTSQQAPGIRLVQAELGVTAWDRYQLAKRQARRGLFPGQTRPVPPAPPKRAALERSRDRYLEALDARPADLPIRERLAELELELGEPGRTLTEVDRLLARVDRVPSWLTLRGDALSRLDRSDEALAAFDAALRIDPAFHRALLERASLRTERQDFEGAALDLESALALDAGDLDTHRKLVRVLRASGDSEAATRALSRLRDLQGEPR